MESITVTDTERNGKSEFKKFDIANYTKSTFSMFAGTETEVKLSVDNSLVGVIADRFGNKVFVTKDDDNSNRFIVNVKVNISHQFFGWLFALGDKVKILSPESVKEKYKNHIDNVLSCYKEVE